MAKSFFLTKGQGLLEATIAIGVIMTGLIGAMTLTTSTVMSSEESEMRIVAANLAREGIEAARIIRDSAWLGGPLNTWRASLASATSPADVTAIVVLDPTNFNWSVDFTPTDFSDNRTSLWRYGAGSSWPGLFIQSLSDLSLMAASRTAYHRLLKPYPICGRYLSGNDEIVNQPLPCPPGYSQVGVRVVSIVQWSEGGRSRNVTLEDWLYDWRFAAPTQLP